MSNNASNKSQMLIRAIFLGILTLVFDVSSYAQCAMCRAALESEGDTAKAEAVNDGIVYLMVIPYVLVGVIGFAIYRTRKNSKKQK
jgi:hypothetical protein